MRRGCKVVFGVGGGIAAFKAVETIRLLMEGGAEVRAVMSAAAARFITPFSLENLTNHEVFSDLWAESTEGETHVRLAAWGDVMVVAPATMELVGKLALGLPDDALTCTVAACLAPLVLAPAMNTVMYAQAALQQNLETLRARGATIVGPVSGRLANGASGLGRMSSPEDIAAAVAMAAGRHGDLAGRRIVVTAGPTQEPLDPVRYIGNRSSGKMGYAVALSARDRGARVTLVSGPVALAEPWGVDLVKVGTAAQMRDAVERAVVGADVLVMAAAVADYRPRTVAPGKIKKGQATLSLDLERTDDILGGLSRAPLLKIGFAAETDHVLDEGLRKLRQKGLDFVVANDVQGGKVFGNDDNHVHMIAEDGAVTTVGPTSKANVAEAILDAVVDALLNAGEIEE